MKSIFSAVAYGQNLLVLLAFAVIGYFLFITPSFNTFSDNAYIGKSVLSFGWNLLFAWLVVWMAALVSPKPVEGKKYYYLLKIKGLVIPNAALICATAAVVRVLLR
jgi:hypothetical protein